MLSAITSKDALLLGLAGVASFGLYRYFRGVNAAAKPKPIELNRWESEGGATATSVPAEHNQPSGSQSP